MVAHLPALHDMFGILDRYLEELEQRFREVATEQVTRRLALILLVVVGRSRHGEASPRSGFGVRRQGVNRNRRGVLKAGGASPVPAS